MLFVFKNSVGDQVEIRNINANAFGNVISIQVCGRANVYMQHDSSLFVECTPAGKLIQCKRICPITGEFFTFAFEEPQVRHDTREFLDKIVEIALKQLREGDSKRLVSAG